MIRTIAILLLASLGAACAGTYQYASISEAHKKFATGNHQRALSLLAQAESAKALSPEQRAETTFLKAQIYEELGEHEQAQTLYRYLSDHHSTSQYGYLAEKKLIMQPPVEGKSAAKS